MAFVLSGCERKPTFDEKYKAEVEDIRARSNSMEAEVAQHLSAADEAARAAAEATPSSSSPSATSPAPTGR